MSNNLVLINSLINDYLDKNKYPENLTNTEMGKIFENITVFQILKKYGITEEDVLTGATDGGQDGGIDFGFIFFNGSLIKDISRFPFLSENCKIDVYIITSKYEDTFRNAPLETMIVSIPELFNLSLDEKKLEYNDKIKKFREKVNFVYKKFILNMDYFNIHFIYVSRGETDKVQGEVLTRSERLQKVTQTSLSEACIDFKFIGCSELVRYWRTSQNIEKQLSVSEAMTSGTNSIVLCKIQEYYKFILNDDGTMNKLLFDSNVRDYMGLNRVNKDILNSLKTEKEIDFWNLNNGITIISPKATVAGKIAFMKNPQIVNGLQTSESIYSYFSNLKSDIKDDRLVLIKIINEQNSENQKKIIKSTNNQTPVDLVNLYATDKYLVDIEIYLQKFDIYFDRKHNFYSNSGIAQDKLVSVLYLASGYLALCLKQPIMGSRLKQKTLDKLYTKIFNEKNDIELWHAIVLIFRKTDEYLNKKKIRGQSEGVLKTWRPFFSYIACSIILGTFSYNMKELKEISNKTEKFTDKIFDEIWDSYLTKYTKLTKKFNKTLNLEIMEQIGKNHNLNNIGYLSSINKTIVGKYSVLSSDFIQQVDNLLPKQPWPRFTSEKIAKSLDCPLEDVRDAIDSLIEDGKYLNQKDGILYDIDGNPVNI